jgi:hypothetical protein
MSTARERRVAEAVRAIRELHATGRKVPPKQSHRDAYNQGTLEEAGEQLGLSTEAVRQARQLADPVAGYTAYELRDLCDLIREVQPDQDDALPVFGKTHLVRMLTVPKSRRAALQRSAVRGAWSTARLEAEIAGRFGSRRAGGRRRRVPQDADGLLVQIEGMCEAWRRLLAEVDADDGEENPGHAVLADLPDAVRRQVRAAGRTLATLQELVTDELRERLPARHVRHHFRDDEGAEGEPPSAPQTTRRN